jgi:protein-tyrosine phosphatase
MELAAPTPPPPKPGTYWVVEGRLLAGPYPGAPEPQLVAGRLAPLLDAGITTFVNLMEAGEVNNDGEPFAPYEPALPAPVSMVRHPIRDLSIPTRSEMTEILDTIDSALEHGGVYVHCWGGVGRTGTTVGCWLLRNGLATPDTVLDRIQTLRRVDPIRGHRPSPETRLQEEFILEWPAGS